jgi:hypothetical protein
MCYSQKQPHKMELFLKFIYEKRHFSGIVGRGSAGTSNHGARHGGMFSSPTATHGHAS